MSRKELKELSRELHMSVSEIRMLNMPLSEIRKELDIYQHYTMEYVNPEKDRENNPAVAERLMEEGIRLAGECRVPIIKRSLITEATLTAAMYIERNYTMNDSLPSFYDRALYISHEQLLKDFIVRDLIVYEILHLAELTDTDEILKVFKLMYEDRRSVARNKNKQPYLFYRFEMMCLRVVLGKYLDPHTPWTESVMLFEYLTRLQDERCRMVVYFCLYHLRTQHMKLTEDGKDIDSSEFNPLTDNLFMEEYLVKAYNTPGYSLHTLDLNSFFDITWARSAVEYAGWMYRGVLNMIPQNREKALKILHFATGLNEAHISQRAGFLLKNLSVE